MVNIVNAFCPLSGVIGGTVTTDGDYCIHTFKANSSFNTSIELTNVSILVVAGGGGAGGSNAGGGGAGGLNYSTGQTISANNYIITIGRGGYGTPAGTYTHGGNGSNSSFNNIMVMGGGAGAPEGGKSGSDGGSGGGGGGWFSGTKLGGIGLTGQGNNGGYGTGISGTRYSGGGGGGAGTAGINGTNTTAGNGGFGLNISINGSTASFAGGGGGGGYLVTAGIGGYGGGGNGAVGSSNGYDAINFTGGGGGGGGNNKGGGAGGDGIIIIRYTSLESLVPKNINLINPNNNSLAVNKYATFAYNFTGYTSSVISSLYINGNYNDSTTPTPNITNYFYKQFANEGIYNWSVNLTDTYGSLSSTMSFFQVDENPWELNGTFVYKQGGNYLVRQCR